MDKMASTANPMAVLTKALKINFSVFSAAVRSLVAPLCMCWKLYVTRLR